MLRPSASLSMARAPQPHHAHSPGRSTPRPPPPQRMEYVVDGEVSIVLGPPEDDAHLYGVPAPGLPLHRIPSSPHTSKPQGSIMKSPAVLDKRAEAKQLTWQIKSARQVEDLNLLYMQYIQEMDHIHISALLAKLARVMRDTAHGRIQHYLLAEQQALIDALLADFSRHMKRYKARELSSCLWSMAVLHQGGCHPELVEQISSFLTASNCGMLLRGKAVDLSNTMWALSRMGWRIGDHRSWLELFDVADLLAAEFSPQELSNVLWALGTALGVEQRRLRSDRERQSGSKERQSGSKERQIGSKERQIGSKERQSGSREHQGGGERHDMGTVDSTTPLPHRDPPPSGTKPIMNPLPHRDPQIAATKPVTSPLLHHDPPTTASQQDAYPLASDSGQTGDDALSTSWKDPIDPELCDGGASGPDLSVSLDSSGLDAPRSNASRSDASRSDNSTSEASRSEASRSNASRSRASRSDASRSEAARSEASKLDASRSEVSISEASRSEASRSEASRSADFRSEASTSDASRSADFRSEASTSEASRSEASRSKASRSEASKSEASRSEASESDPTGILGGSSHQGPSLSVHSFDCTHPSGYHDTSRGPGHAGLGVDIPRSSKPSNQQHSASHRESLDLSLLLNGGFGDRALALALLPPPRGPPKPRPSRINPNPSIDRGTPSAALSSGFGRQEIANMAWACARLGCSGNPDLLGALAQCAVAQKRSLTAQGVSMLAWAYARLGHQDDALVEALADASRWQARKLSGQGISNLMWAFGKFGHSRFDLYRLLSREAMFKLDEFQTGGLATVLSTWAIWDFYDPALVAPVMRSITDRLTEFKHGQLHKVLSASARLRHADRALLTALSRQVLAWASVCLRDGALVRGGDGLERSLGVHVEGDSSGTPDSLGDRSRTSDVVGDNSRTSDALSVGESVALISLYAQALGQPPQPSQRVHDAPASQALDQPPQPLQPPQLSQRVHDAPAVRARTDPGMSPGPAGAQGPPSSTVGKASLSASGLRTLPNSTDPRLTPRPQHPSPQHPSPSPSHQHPSGLHTLPSPADPMSTPTLTGLNIGLNTHPHPPTLNTDTHRPQHRPQHPSPVLDQAYEAQSTALISVLESLGLQVALSIHQLSPVQLLHVAMSYASVHNAPAALLDALEQEVGARCNQLSLTQLFAMTWSLSILRRLSPKMHHYVCKEVVEVVGGCKEVVGVVKVWEQPEVAATADATTASLRSVPSKWLVRLLGGLGSSRPYCGKLGSEELSQGNSAASCSEQATGILLEELSQPNDAASFYEQATGILLEELRSRLHDLDMEMLSQLSVVLSSSCDLVRCQSVDNGATGRLGTPAQRLQPRTCIHIEGQRLPAGSLPAGSDPVVGVSAGSLPAGSDPVVGVSAGSLPAGSDPVVGVSVSPPSCSVRELLADVAEEATFKLSSGSPTDLVVLISALQSAGMLNREMLARVTEHLLVLAEHEARLGKKPGSGLNHAEEINTALVQLRSIGRGH
eukprot:gene11778-14929_t